MPKSSKLLEQFGIESDANFLASVKEPTLRRMKSFEALKRRYLRRTSDAFERLEIRRRIAETLVSIAAHEHPKILLRYLRRLERLGYSTPDRLVWACAIANHQRSHAGVRNELAKMLRRADRMLNRIGLLVCMCPNS